MLQVGVGELKSRLSHYLGITQGGEEVLVTDRGRPVAKLVPLTDRAADLLPHLRELERRGEIRIGSARVPRTARRAALPKVRSGLSAVQALLDERAEGR